MKCEKNSAVSPVVGVMLMLVVVIIIAAVVSGFAGGLVGGNNQKAPQISMDVRIANTGYYVTSFFSAVVTGQDGAVNTKDLKLVTSWNKVQPNGTKINGGATIIPNQINTHLHYTPCAWLANDWWNYTAPQGYGAGLENNAGFWPAPQLSDKSSCTASSPYHYSSIGTCISNESWWGNHPLVVGTSLYARPFGWSATPAQGGQPGSSFTVGYGLASNGAGVVSGGGQYKYAYGTSPSSGGSSGADFYPVDDATYPSVDQMMAVLGNNWNVLRAGDTVNVKLIHIPSGKTIWQKDVVVEG